MIAELIHARKRRKELMRSIDVKGSFHAWEESCVPSYVHRNPLAAFVSWRRLFVAAKLGNRLVGRPAKVLDFGSSVGELSHILNYAGEYHFVESDDASAEFLLSQNSRARRLAFDDVPASAYDIVFAIDSLEHNENFATLLERLASCMKPNGILILSGPTENALYRLGRRIAGFEGEYHLTTIYDIEHSAAEWLKQLELVTVPFGIPLFRISAWELRSERDDAQQDAR
jgi:2-polyprenyl-3-methyl-5-hydroxy-6-metoxy-1,4-benzoquinol methylase